MGERHLAATPWPAEDGGPCRQQVPHGLVGPRAGGGRLAAVRQAALSVMALLAPGNRVLVLRSSIGPDGVSWVEDVDPVTLDEVGRSPDLALGPFWPGGFGVLADGAVIVVQGRHAHRLAPDLSLERSRALPVEAPYNSFVVLADGSLATKDLQRPDGTPSRLSILDPVTLEDRTEPFQLPEPCVARLSADGDDLVVVGTTALHRLRWDPAAGRVEAAADPVPYLVHDGQSFGWDPVVAAGAVWWLDNGDHTFPNGFTMLGNGVAPGPVRLWRLPDGSSEAQSVEICGQPGGAVTNPPLVDAERGIVVGYDSANGVMSAFSTTDLSPLWSRPLNTSTHLILFPDTGEIVANDHDREAGDAVVIVDIADGTVRAHVRVDSPAQSVVFPAPGRERDVYYVSLSTIARVELTD